MEKSDFQKNMAECHRFLINRLLKNNNGLLIPLQTRAHDTAAFQGAPVAQNQYHMPPAAAAAAAAAEVQPVMLPPFPAEDVPCAWSLPDMEQIYDILTEVDLDQLPEDIFTSEDLPEDMLMHALHRAIQPVLPLQSVPPARLVPSAPPVFFAENLPNSAENMVMHVPIHSGPVQPPMYLDNHVKLPVAEVHRDMQPAPPLQPAQPVVPSALPVPPTPPPPVRSKIRKRWTDEEHELFVKGLETFGRGDWRRISRYFVKSRTPSQIASHAQKYYLRQQMPEKKRKSIHDKVIKEPR